MLKDTENLLFFLKIEEVFQAYFFGSPGTTIPDPDPGNITFRSDPDPQHWYIKGLTKFLCVTPWTEVALMPGVSWPAAALTRGGVTGRTQGAQHRAQACLAPRLTHPPLTRPTRA